jgi:hypothetical protein
MTEEWLTSRQVANFLAIHRDNDLRVAIGSELVPIAEVRYYSSVDALVIEPVEGEALKNAFGDLISAAPLVNFRSVIVAKEFLVIQCDVCDWIGGVDPPFNLGDLVVAALNHAKVCQ